jgi:starch phosphorylase
MYDINLNFLQFVERNFPGDRELLGRVSIIEESQPKMVRMAYLALIGSHKVNGVAELHSDLIKTTIFKDFVKIYGPDKFTNVTNGITPRRWLHQANPKLSKLIASKLGGHEFLKDLTLLHKLEAFVDDKEFRKEFRDIKYENKVRQHPGGIQSGFSNICRSASPNISWSTTVSRSTRRHFSMSRSSVSTSTSVSR